VDKYKQHCAAFVLCILSGSASADVAPAAPATGFPDGAGRDRFLVVCNGCHNPNFTLGRGYTRAQWERTVNAMKERGAKITPQDLEAIVGYLQLMSEAERRNKR